MTIASAIQNAQEKVRNAYTAVSGKGGTVPTEQNLNNLPEAISSISGGAGDIVNTTAMSGAESFTGGEKVVLNPADSTTAAIMTVTGGEIASAASVIASHSDPIGGIVLGDNLYSMYFTSTAWDHSHVTYTGSIESDAIQITQGSSLSQLCYVTLPVFSRNGVGIHKVLGADSNRSKLVAVKTDGSLVDLTSSVNGSNGFTSSPDGSVIVYSPSGRTATVYFIKDDLSFTSFTTPSTTYYWNEGIRILQTGTLNYAYGVFDNSGNYKILEFSENGSQAVYAYSNSGLSGAHVPLDYSGILLTYTGSQAVIQRFSSTTKTIANIPVSQQGDTLPGILQCAVLPITAERSIADIYIVPNETPARIDHYVWDGSRLTNKGAVLSSEDLGEYVYSGDQLHLDGKTGILWGIFYKTQAGSGAQGKVFAVQTQGRTVITQFKAEPADKAVFDPSKSLTGFVDSNLGLDVMGNTELSVKTALDPNAEPWSDIGRVFGFDVKVTKGEY